MNPSVSPMTWEDFQTMVSDLTSGRSGNLSSTAFTQFLNVARMAIEQEREWNVLKKYDTSLSWSPPDTFQTAKALPTAFGRWCDDLPVQLWDGNTQNPTVLPVTIVPYQDQLWNYSTNYTAAIDYTTMQLYFMGNAGQQWTVVLSYIQDNGDIVQASGGTSYTWTAFPARFHKFLAYDVACRYNLGISYDDLSARNADDNGAQAERIKKAMFKWDATLTRSFLAKRDYMPPDYPQFVQGKITGFPL